MKKLLFFIPILILFASCDPGCEYSYYVDNNSDYNVTVTFKTYSEAQKSVVVLPDSNILVHSEFDLGIANDLNEHFLYVYDTIYIEIDENHQLKKDLLKRDNWTYEKTDGKYRFGDGGVGNYTFLITNDDVEIITKL